jgi:hypothetical protein
VAPCSSRCGDKVEVTSLPRALLVLLLITVLIHESKCASFH